MKVYSLIPLFTIHWQNMKWCIFKYICISLLSLISRFNDTPKEYFIYSPPHEGRRSSPWSFWLCSPISTPPHPPPRKKDMPIFRWNTQSGFDMSIILRCFVLSNVDFFHFHVFTRIFRGYHKIHVCGEELLVFKKSLVDISHDTLSSPWQHFHSSNWNAKNMYLCTILCFSVRVIFEIWFLFWGSDTIPLTITMKGKRGFGDIINVYTITKRSWCLNRKT